MERLPVDDVLPDLLAALAAGPSAVLSAPPGAGKTTRVPLALMDAPWLEGRVLVLEPRRMAARAAAERLAAQLGEPVGRRVGYRIRGEGRQGSRIEVITEGILTRMLQSAPDLPGIGAILFDEVHERSIHTDLGLALALEVQEALRPGLRLLPMSATLDVGVFSRLMGDAPVIESAGRAHAVETRWLDRSWRRPGEGRRGHLDAALALILRALDETDMGDVLAFLPGAGEIGRAAARLRADAPALEIAELHGSLPFARQRAVLEPRQGPRRVVLATSIAETSLTVPGVRVVVDTGLSRRSRTDPGTGLARLVTVPVSRAEADQRRGRAGRLGPGVCYRMWTMGEEGGLPAFAPPEIAETDLAPLALELALWGAHPGELRWLDPPPEAAFAAARKLLAGLGALDGEGRITTHGRAMAAEPLHPRLSHMLLRARARGQSGEAALLAALLQERDPLRGHGADLRDRLRAAVGRRDPAADAATLARIRAEAARIARGGRALETAPGGSTATPSPSLPHEGGGRRATGASGTEPNRLGGGNAPQPPPDRPTPGRPPLHPLSRFRDGAEVVVPRPDADTRAGPDSTAGRLPSPSWGRHGEEAAAARPGAVPGERRNTTPDRAAALAGVLAAEAYPDRIALRRPGGDPRYLLSGGRGAALDAADPLAGERLLVAVDVEDGPEARIRLAAPITEAELREAMADRIVRIDSVEWSPRTARVEARRREMLGAIALSDGPWHDAPPDRIGAALAEGIRARGLAALNWTPAALSLRARVGWLHRQRGPLAGRLPDWSDEALLATVEEWLVPHLSGERRIEDIRVDPGAALRATLDPHRLHEIDRHAPARVETPLGSAQIDYARDRPTISVRVQELFGVTRHPTVGDPPVPLLVELLSPAMRPVQTTADLPGFWASSYGQVRRDMRARYPKHPWPEDPASAQPTRRAKPRGR